MVDVSVVIATRNRELLVKQAIDSVLAQTEPVREVIVVDDGSVDGTRAQLSAYGDRIRVFHQENEGASAARNRAIRAAQAAWIAFLDDDDVWLETKIERQMALIRQNPGLGIVYCSDYSVDEQLRILYTRTALPDNRGDVFERLILKNFIFTSCVLASKDLIQAAGYMNREYQFAEDWDLWLRIAATHPVDFVPEPLVLYRQSFSGCLTQQLSAEKCLHDMDRILISATRLRKVPRRVKMLARHQLEAKWAGAFLSQGSNGLAFWHAIKAALARPLSPTGYQILLRSMLPKQVRSWTKRAILRPERARTETP
jgi:glycosyltransferase involved in cell wall biosynthesis